MANQFGKTKISQNVLLNFNDFFIDGSNSIFLNFTCSSQTVINFFTTSVFMDDEREEYLQLKTHKNEEQFFYI